MFDEPNSEDIRVLLRVVETDAMRTSPNRALIRGSVLAAFDSTTESAAQSGSGKVTEGPAEKASPPPIEPSAAPIEPAPPEAHIIDLIPSERASPGPKRSSRFLGWAAAVIAIVIGAALLVPAARPTETAAPITTGSAFLNGAELPTPLIPGPQNTGTFAGGLSFDAPDGLAVIAANEDQLVLALASDLEATQGQLMFLQMDAFDWQALLLELARNADVTIKEVAVSVDGRAATRLDVTVTNEAMAVRSCAIAQPCINLRGMPTSNPFALWAGSENRITEIGSNDGSMVLAIEVSRQFQGTLSLLVAQVVGSASLNTG